MIQGRHSSEVTTLGTRSAAAPTDGERPVRYSLRITATDTLCREYKPHDRRSTCPERDTSPAARKFGARRTGARLGFTSIEITSDGTSLYIVDMDNFTIRRIDIATRT
jgi:hypothetical protein